MINLFLKRLGRSEAGGTPTPEERTTLLVKYSEVYFTWKVPFSGKSPEELNNYAYKWLKTVILDTEPHTEVFL